MSRLPQGCATFTRLVFILDLGGRGYESREESERRVRKLSFGCSVEEEVVFW